MAAQVTNHKGLACLLAGIDRAADALKPFGEAIEAFERFRSAVSPVAEAPATPEIGAAAADLRDAMTETIAGMIAMRSGVNAVRDAMRRLHESLTEATLRAGIAALRR